MEKRFVVYKCVFDDYDVVLRPKYLSEDCDYVVVTDNEQLSAPGWRKHVVSPEPFSSPKEANLFFRSSFHKQLSSYEASLYLDGNIQIARDIYALFEEFVKKGVALGLQAHPDRVSVKEEVEACIQFSKLQNIPDAWAELEHYRSLGFPDDVGVFETGIIFKNHCVSGLDDAMNTWYSEFRKFGQRDQMSLPYVIWKTGVSYSTRSYGLRNPEPEFFFLYPHWKSRSKLDWLNVYIRARRYDGGIWPVVNRSWDMFQVMRAKVSFKRHLRKLIKG